MSTASAATREIPAACRARLAPVLCSIRTHHHRWNAARTQLGLALVPYGWYAEAHPGANLRERVLDRIWAKDKRIHRRLSTTSASPWSQSWYSDALCVHSHEGAWTANTGNGYYGGMQMDASFEAAYGAEFLRAYGEAGNWPPHDQLIAAYRAWRVRGWSPWPNTSVMCGL